jgi:hypothetical protein
MSLDLSRETFKVEQAPRWQRCSCGCGQVISEGLTVYGRASLSRGGGTTRIIDLEDHYRAWLEKEARKAAAIRAQQDPAFASYLGGRR